MRIARSRFSHKRAALPRRQQSAQAAAITHRKRREQTAKDLDIETRRLSVAVGDELVDAVWSNTESVYYCLACADVAAPPVVKQGVERGTPCACCHGGIGVDADA